MNAIEIRNLSKRYGEKMALNGLNMSVPVGSIYGFIGENGSGKSTTEKLVCGLINKTSGDIKLFGKSNKDVEARKQIGTLIEAPGCFPSLSVWNNLLLQAKSLGIKQPEKSVRELLRLVHMDSAASNQYKNCSLGMKQRVGIAMALLGNPKLLVLDEPINALDADGVRIVRKVLLKLKEEGVTILISSHILGELEKIATHYGIIRHGKMLQEITAEELEKNCETFVYIKCEDLAKAKTILEGNYPKLKLEEEELRIYNEEDPSRIAKTLFEKGIIIKEVGKKKIGLEEYYSSLMQEERR